MHYVHYKAASKTDASLARSDFIPFAPSSLTLFSEFREFLRLRYDPYAVSFKVLSLSLSLARACPPLPMKWPNSDIFESSATSSFQKRVLSAKKSFRGTSEGVIKGQKNLALSARVGTT